MPTRPPHHVSSLTFRISCLFRISSFGFRISPDPSGRIMRNEPNLPYHRPTQDRNEQNEPNYPYGHGPGAPGCPYYAKRTQFTPTPAWPTSQIYETNPICPITTIPPRQEMRNETPSDRTPAPGGPPMVNPHFQCGTPHDPKNAKRTQSTPTPAWPKTQIRETNPICHPDSFAAPPFPQNEPNSRTPAVPTHPIMRNEPNLTRPTAKKSETNPISGAPDELWNIRRGSGGACQHILDL